jgi:hypothetical protein
VVAIAIVAKIITTAVFMLEEMHESITAEKTASLALELKVLQVMRTRRITQVKQIVSKVMNTHPTYFLKYTVCAMDYLLPIDIDFG